MQRAERERLIHSMSDTLSAGPWTLFGCACGLGVLVLVVTVFPGSESAAQTATRVAGAPPISATVTVIRADVHRKLIFDDRHAKSVARAPRLVSTSDVRGYISPDP
jgi:hypothetical protein